MAVGSPKGRALPLALVFAGMLLAACSGPEAPDAAVCQDLIHRLCLPPRCPSVDTQLDIREGDDCEALLRARTGCGDPAFQFTVPSRERFLTCREPLVRGGDHRDDHPSCPDVDEALACAGLQDFLNGRAP